MLHFVRVQWLRLEPPVCSDQALWQPLLSLLKAHTMGFDHADALISLASRTKLVLVNC